VARLLVRAGLMQRIRRYLSRSLEAGPGATLRIIRARLGGYLLLPFCLLQKTLGPGNADLRGSFLRAGSRLFLFTASVSGLTPLGSRTVPGEFRFLRSFQEHAGPGNSVDRADDFIRGQVEILGLGALRCGYVPAWNRDFVSGFEWPGSFHKRIDYVQINTGCDVKVPWELSRLHCLTWLAQAWVATGDSKYTDASVAVLRDWRSKNPVGFGVNWTCSMEVAIRAVNILCAFSLFRRAIPGEFERFVQEMLLEHYLHLDFNLEISDVNGNHLLFDRFGLAIIACEIFGAHSTPAARAVDALCDEIRGQFQADGVHLENSTAYQRLVIEAVVFFVAYCVEREIRLPEDCKRLVSSGLMFLDTIRLDGGGIPLFGDADSGNVFQLSGDSGNSAFKLLDFLRRSTFGDVLDPGASGKNSGNGGEKIRLMPFPDGGFYVMRAEKFCVCIKAGKGGLKGRGSHDHNDQLGFSMDVFGTPLFIDPGTHNYTRDAERHVLDLTTRRHNTVMIQGEEQRPILFGSTTYTVRFSEGTCTTFDCIDGLAVFEGCVSQSGHSFSHGEHARKITAMAVSGEECRLLVEDTVRCVADAGCFSCEATFFVPAGWQIDIDGTDGMATLRREAVHVEMQTTDAVKLEIENAEYSPEYGRICGGYVLRFLFAGARETSLNTCIVCRSVKSL
jgi:hypothetical protein